MVLLLVLSTGCASNFADRLAGDALGGLLENLQITLASDEDPELVRAALPLALELSEALVLDDPSSIERRVNACSGFVQYAFAFVETDALLLEVEEPRRARELERRSLRLYLRALDHCQQGLDVLKPGLVAELLANPEAAAQQLGSQDLDLLYWSAAAWGSAIAQGLDRPDLVADLPVVRALVVRGLELDPEYQQGAFHGAAISLAALPETLGGSPEQARFHFQQVVELTGGSSAGPYVTLARTITVAEQNVTEFRQLLEQALAVDPDVVPGRRLENLIAQRQAEALREREEDFFFILDSEEEW
ncbi:MAG: TRAP transporter TatT component family protein [Acidobacteriota bacterium]